MSRSQKAIFAKIGILGAAIVGLVVGLGQLPRALALFGLTGRSQTSTSQWRRLDLNIDPVIVPSADRLTIQGTMPSDIAARESTLTVRDASGGVIYSRGGVLHGSQSPLDIAMGYPGSPLPASIPPGSYSLLWTVDGLQSNSTRFTVGPERPDFLTAEYPEYPDGRCHNTALVVHVYPEQPFEYCRLITGLVIGVDRDEALAFPGCSNPVRGYAVDRPFSVAIAPPRLNLPSAKAHDVWVTFDGHRSNTVHITCN